MPPPALPVQSKPGLCIIQQQSFGINKSAVWSSASSPLSTSAFEYFLLPILPQPAFFLSRSAMETEGILYFPRRLRMKSGRLHLPARCRSPARWTALRCRATDMADESREARIDVLFRTCDDWISDTNRPRMLALSDI